MPHSHSHSRDGEERVSLLNSEGSPKEIKASKHVKAKKRFPWLTKERTFQFVGLITLLYSIAELSVAVATESLTLLSDGFHNLSDVAALGVAYYAHSASKQVHSFEMTYGWKRAEVLGGLTNGVALLSLCLYVLLEAIPRLIDPPAIDSGVAFMITASFGVLINTLGTLIFAVAGMSHSHGHSHGHGHSHDHGNENSHKGTENSSSSGGLRGMLKMDLNTWAVFVHYLGDMLSSFLVLIAGIIMHFSQGRTAYWIDPVSSLIIIVLILVTTIPLVRNCLAILLQKTPVDVQLQRVKENIEKVDGVLGSHDLHCWSLGEDVHVMTVHVVCKEDADDQAVIKALKEVFHASNVHSSTVQIERVKKLNGGLTSASLTYCLENCTKDCDEHWCCKKIKKAEKKKLKKSYSAPQLGV